MSDINNNDILNGTQEELLKDGDVARILNVSLSKAYSIIQTGEIASVHIGFGVRVRRIDLLKFITDCTPVRISKYR